LYEESEQGYFVSSERRPTQVLGQH